MPFLLLGFYIIGCKNNSNSKIEFLLRLANNKDKLFRDSLLLENSYKLGTQIYVIDNFDFPNRNGYVNGSIKNNNYEFIHFFKNEKFDGFSFTTTNEKQILSIIQNLKTVKINQSNSDEDEYILEDIIIRFPKNQVCILEEIKHPIYEIIIGKNIK